MTRRGGIFAAGWWGAVASWAVVLLMAAAGGCDRAEPVVAAAAADDERQAGAASAAAPDHYLTGAGAPARVVAAASPAPKPTGPLAAGASCVTAECHAQMATSKHIHGPVSTGSCDTCHAADTGTHRFPLKRGPLETCTFCHAVSGTAAHQHKALEQGCTSCHRPHESATKFLLKGMNVEDTCMRCHEVPMKRFAHTPFAKGECTTCHQPHQSDGPHLMRAADEVGQCLTCHQDMGRAMKVPGVKVHKPATEACTSCHTPHASEMAMQLKAPVAETCVRCHEAVREKAASARVGHAAMLDEKSCANCHAPHASGQPHMLKARADEVCLTCHDKPQTASDGRTIADMRPSLAARFLHGPVKEANCSACHEVHGSANDGLLKQPFPKSFYAPFDVGNYALCFTCHEKDLVLTAKTTSLTEFRDGEKNLHFAHVNREEKGRSCKTCHSMHGSDLPRHMAGEVPMGDGKWAMPMGYEQTADGGRCAPGCHTPREYKRTSRPGAATAPAAGGGVR